MKLSFLDDREGTKLVLDHGPFATEARYALHEAGLARDTGAARGVSGLGPVKRHSRTLGQASESDRQRPVARRGPPPWGREAAKRYRLTLKKYRPWC